MFKSFNNPDTVGVISSYPAKNGEVARDNAISRYTNLLIRPFPKNQKVVVFSEKRRLADKPFLVSKNILVIPIYSVDNPFFFVQIIKSLSNFSEIRDFLVQFEFSIYGGKKIIPGFLTLLSFLKLNSKNVSIVMHQVATDLNTLHGHLGLTKNSFKANFLSIFTKYFYVVTGFLTQKIIVHDETLKQRFLGLVPTNKITVIPHAVGDLNKPKVGKKFEKSARVSFGLKKEDMVLTVYGYRSWYKGTDFIVNAVSQISKKHPNKKIKLLVAGGVSPTLKNTGAYKVFDKNLKKEIKEANGNIRVSEFIPEKDVWKVFAVSNIMLFPYRTRMSASGAFSLAMSYKKPFMVSGAFSEGLGLAIPGAVFNLNSDDFGEKLLGFIANKGIMKESVKFGIKMADGRSWDQISKMYLATIKSTINTDVNFVDNKDYGLVQA